MACLQDRIFKRRVFLWTAYSDLNGMGRNYVGEISLIVLLQQGGQVNDSPKGFFEKAEDAKLRTKDDFRRQDS